MNLIHFTRTPEAVANILREGFGYVAWPTKTARFVLPELPLLDREPQQFGMISFRMEGDEDCSKAHRQRYGSFGVCIDQNWALAHGAHPVIYVSEGGSVARAFRERFKSAKQVLDRELTRHPTDLFRLRAYGNAAAAGALGASEWATLLQIYQYMAPASDAEEHEWRIVQPHPLYSIPRTAAEAVAQLSPAQGWARILNSIRLTPEAIRYIIGPKGSASRLRPLLSADFSGVEIREETLGQ